MIKRLIRHGNSAALVIDKPILDLLRVDLETPLEIATDGRNIIISPQADPRGEDEVREALERVNKRHGAALRRLGE